MSEDVCPHGHVGHMKFRVATGRWWCTECELTRSRERRKYSHRGQTVNLERLSRRRSLQIFGAEPVGEYWRPKTRGDCARVPRPCPFVACKWHLFVDVTDAGSITFNFPGKEPDELERSCALDVADDCEQTLDSVATAINISRERARQVEEKVLRKLAAVAKRLERMR